LANKEAPRTLIARSRLKRFKQILEEKLIELRPTFRRRDDIAIVGSADALDEIQLATARWPERHTE
jgi:hypothetical protein